MENALMNGINFEKFRIFEKFKAHKPQNLPKMPCGGGS